MSLSGIFPSSDWPLWRGTGGGSPGEQGAGILSFGTIQKRRENVVREAGDSDPHVPPPPTDYFSFGFAMVLLNSIRKNSTSNGVDLRSLL